MGRRGTGPQGRGPKASACSGGHAWGTTQCWSPKQEVCKCHCDVPPTAGSQALWEGGRKPRSQQHTQACAHAQTRKHTHSCAHAHEHASTHARTHAHRHAHTNTQAHAQAHTHGHKRTQTHTHTHEHTNMHAQARTHTRTLKHTYSRAHTLAQPAIKTLSPFSSPYSLHTVGVH